MQQNRHRARAIAIAKTEDQSRKYALALGGFTAVALLLLTAVSAITL